MTHFQFFIPRGEFCCFLTTLVVFFSVEADLLVSSLELGAEGTGWVVDVVGRVWYTTGITAAKPHGDGQFWQVE